MSILLSVDQKLHSAQSIRSLRCGHGIAWLRSFDGRGPMQPDAGHIVGIDERSGIAMHIDVLDHGLMNIRQIDPLGARPRNVDQR